MADSKKSNTIRNAEHYGRGRAQDKLRDDARDLFEAVSNAVTYLNRRKELNATNYAAFDPAPEHWLIAEDEEFGPVAYFDEVHDPAIAILGFEDQEFKLSEAILSAISKFDNPPEVLRNLLQIIPIGLDIGGSPARLLPANPSVFDPVLKYCRLIAGQSGASKELVIKRLIEDYQKQNKGKRPSASKLAQLAREKGLDISRSTANRYAREIVSPSRVHDPAMRNARLGNSKIRLDEIIYDHGERKNCHLPEEPDLD